MAVLFCGSVNNGSLNESIAKEQLSDLIVNLVGLFYNYIEHLQKDHDYGKNVYNQMFMLAKNWGYKEINFK